jgi:hypothetical protein
MLARSTPWPRRARAAEDGTMDGLSGSGRRISRIEHGSSKLRRSRMIKRLAIPLVLASLLAVGSAVPTLAQEQSPVPTGLGGRIELLAAGYALTVPDDWVAIAPSIEDIDAIVATLSTFDPELATTVENALAGGVGFSLMAFGDLDAATGFRENCNVIDGASDGTSLGVLAASEAAAFAEMGDRLASGPEVTMLELPAGKVARIDYGLRYPNLETAHAAYYFSDGATLHLLTCTGVERAEDDWLSIAEAFEILSGS